MFDSLRKTYIYHFLRVSHHPNKKFVYLTETECSDSLPNTVLVGFIAIWFIAGSPINRSVSLKATQDGVVLLPRSFGMITTRSFCHTPTHEFVVPRSIPIAGAFLLSAIDDHRSLTEVKKHSSRENIDSENSYSEEKWVVSLLI